ncbi:MAG TPA: ribbon-helix-helix domain-containing protein [Ardenticatenaceae bacterium]|nr:ribbon-helix-helix domain-containing protein [Ardenticatenaceae bacterium]
MKIKTSITLSEELVRRIDECARAYPSRSEFIEVALQSYIARMEREAQDARDLAILNQHAERLNQEALDVLDYQAEL